MKGNREIAAVALGLAGVAGCNFLAEPSVTSVSIDVDRVMAAEPRWRPNVPAMPSPPPAIAGRTITTPGLPQREITPQTKAVEAVREEIRRQQEATRRRLERQIRALYETEIRAKEAELRRALAATEATQQETLSRAIRTLFEAYANERAPLLARLSVLAGFPDPNPNSEPPPPTTGAVTRQKFEEAERIRRQMSLLQAKFLADVQELVNETDLSLSDARLRLLRDLEEFRTELDLRAEREARRLVTDAAREMQLELTRLGRLTVPGTPSESLTIPPSPALTPIPQVTYDPKLFGEAARREPVMAELHIWLGLQRYRLDSKGPDRTDEFIAWRRQQRAP